MADENQSAFAFITSSDKSEMLMPLVVVGILALMILPLPPLLLDILIAINITIALIMLLTSIQVQSSLEFSVFPALLLVTTLFRLSLNVASTRLILTGGSTGTDAAGEIIMTFGHFIIGGSYVVGIVVFLILMLINFIVITKGSGRIAEVTARFTLDALPGKQMSIDSDLASGLITQDDARQRRDSLAKETEFYGAMDGSSKFVRGDAIAGLVITAINIVGGLFIGVIQDDMTFAAAGEAYTVLTIGDALVSQIPALLISTAAGLVITRVADDRDLGTQVTSQLFREPKVLVPGAGILVAIALVPNMPIFPFALLIVGLLFLAKQGGKDLSEEQTDKQTKARTQELSEEEQLEKLLPVETLELEVGYALVKLVDTRKGGEVVKRISGLRRNIAQELGIILPPVHVRDNLELKPGGYRLLIHGVESASGEVMSDRLLAMDPGDASETIEGVATTEPAYGLPALWIRPSQKTRAEIAGYTVVEPSTVIVTHISEVLHRESHNLIGREELQQLLEVVAKRNSKIVEELVPSLLSHAELQTVIRALLRDGVSVRDMRSILEVLTKAAATSKEIPFLVDQVRARLGPSIIQTLLGDDQRLHVAFFDPESEEIMRSALVSKDSETQLALNLATAQTLVRQLQRVLELLQADGYAPVVIVPQDLRYALQRFASRFTQGVVVICQREIPPRVEVATDLTLGLNRLAESTLQREAANG